MFRRIDQSAFLLKAIENVSKYFAQRRGLLIVIGTALLIFGFILEFINVFAQLQLINALEVVFRNVGIISALIGVMLSHPLGS